MKRKMSVSKYFLITYLVIASIPVLISVLMNGVLFHVIDSYNEERYMGLLSQVSDNTTQHIDTITSIPQLILNSPAASKYMNYDIYNRFLPQYDPSCVTESMNLIKTYVATNELLENIYFYSTKNDTFINSETTIRAGHDYGSTVRAQTLDYSSFKSKILSVPSYNKVYPQTMLEIGGEDIDCFYYITTTPLFDQSVVNGGMMVVIDSQKFFSMIESSLPKDSAFFYFYHGDQLIVKSDHAPQIQNLDTGEKTIETIQDTKYIVYRTRSNNDRRFAVAVPYKDAMKAVSTLRNSSYMITLVSLLVCALIALYFTKSNIRPLNQILDTAKGYLSQPQKNEYDMISGAMNALIDSDTNLRQQSAQNKPILVSNFLRSILTGNLVDPEEIQNRINQLELDHFQGSFLLVNLSILVPEGDVSLKTQARKLALQNLCTRLNCLHTEVDDASQVFIACFPKEDENNIYAVEQCITSIPLPESVTLKVAVSKSYLSLPDSFFAYQETKDFLSYGIQTELNHIIWCVENPVTHSMFYYPLEMEMRLLTSFKSGNTDAICETLNILYRENSEKRVITGNNFLYLCFGVKGTIFKILDQYSIDPTQLKKTESQLKELDNTVSLTDFFTKAKEIFLDLRCSLEKSENENLSRALLSFIENHYTDPNLSRQSFAQQFQISEDYVSKFFKEHTGFTFMEYLTKTRIESACKLLEGSNYTIDKISEAVGYNSDTSFRRAFKAHTGMSPREYKQKSATQ